jgi:hypothetical protein
LIRNGRSGKQPSPAHDDPAGAAARFLFRAFGGIRARDQAGHRHHHLHVGRRYDVAVATNMEALLWLLHGLGFAGVLHEIGLPRADFVTGLIAFNGGVEFGHLA